MVIGAGWAGARSMTATAGPGISLMSEFIGLAYYTEVPAVIVDVQRVGPSTGLPTRTQQCDLLSTAVLSHGDTRHPMLHPRLAGGVLLHDGGRLRPGRAVPDAGLRHVRSRPRHEQLDGRSVRVPRPAVSAAARCSTAEDLDRLGGFARYKDIDGDGVGYRTLPGTKDPRAAYFTRGSGHDEQAQYSERPVGLHPQRRPPGAQVRGDTKARAAAGGGDLRERLGRPHLLRHVALRDTGEPRPTC